MTNNYTMTQQPRPTTTIVEQSIARLMLTLGGNALTIVGTGFTTLGFIYLINRVTGNAISVIEYIPTFFDSTTISGDEKDRNTGSGDNTNSIGSETNRTSQKRRYGVVEPLFTRRNVFSSVKTYVKIILLIVIGILMKTTAGRIMADSYIRAIEQYIYSRRGVSG